MRSERKSFAGFGGGILMAAVLCFILMFFQTAVCADPGADVPDSYCESEKITVQNVTPGNQSFTVTVKGGKRNCIVHVPPSYDPSRKWPVVIIFHGGGGSAEGAMRETGWALKADKEGFLAVFPEGTPADPSRPARFRDNGQTWNDGSDRSNLGAVRLAVDDIEFVSMMISDLKVRFNADELRIYATGFSNGASMTFRVARELSQILAAAAPVAGADWLGDKTPERLVPILYITGTKDPLNPIEGGAIRIGQKTFGKKPPTQEMIDKWVKMASCSGSSRVIYDKDGATGIAYGTPDEAAKVVLYTINGHGHHWPGEKAVLPESIAGKNIAKINATDIIWDFFKAHPKTDIQNL